MFKLPYGPLVEKEIETSDGSIMPFDHGAITTYLGRRKTPTGHRIVRGGRVVGWLAEPAKGKKLLGGLDAKKRLDEVENEQHRLVAVSWTLHGLGMIADVVPEAFEHAADRQGLASRGNVLERLLSRDLVMVLDSLNEREEVRGAMAVDQGMLIEARGDLPGDSEALAKQIGMTLSGRKAMAEDLGLSNEGHWTLHTGDGSLLLAEVGEIALAAWTESEVDHARLINTVSALLDGKIGPASGQGELIPAGFVLRKGKSGTDAVVSMLAAASSEQVTGHLSSGKSEKSVQVALVNGVPVALRVPEGLDYKGAMERLTDSKRVLELHRMPVGTILTSQSGNVEQFSLETFCEMLSTIRTRTESRQELLRGKLDEILGFEVGIEKLRKERSSVEFEISVLDVNMGLQIVEGSKAIDSGLRRSVEKAEHRVMELEKEIASLNIKLEDSEKVRTAARISADEANLQTSNLLTNIESHNSEINRMQIELTEAKSSNENAIHRSERLAKRVNELEHQLSSRATELARALGDSRASAELASKIEEMANKEAILSADINLHSSKLTEIRDLIDNEERRLRLLTEQVDGTRDRHRRSQAELVEIETRINSSELHLKGLDAEAKISIDRAEESRRKISQDESRAENLQGELKELMEERRNLLREIGDIGAKRGQTEADLSILVEQAEALSAAHQDALEDIREAEILRAKLNEEPLAQALLNDKGTFASLGPVIERLEHARTLGYSVTMLDRAVERSLQVIQETVDQVARTPRHLLSNEVMSLLERQVPDTAGAVRGLARWSVQQRLEHQLGETVNHLVLDLENLLEDYDRAITMLRRIKNVLEQLEKLGAPVEQIEALMSNCKRPESLPHLAKETRRLIQVALDDIHIESDLRDAGSAVKLEATTSALEELITQLDASGLTDGTPRGSLWDFQREGLLPWEKSTIPDAQRIKVDEEIVEGMSGELIQEDIAIQSDNEKIPEEWESMGAPTNDDNLEMVDEIGLESPDAQSTNFHDERAALEDELARLDARWHDRTDSEVSNLSDVMLSSLEEDLAQIDL